MTISLIDFVFVAFCGKHLKMQTFYIDAKFLSGGKKLINMVQFRGKNWQNSMTDNKIP